MPTAFDHAALAVPATPPPERDKRGVPSRARGWSGIGFVLILLVCEAAVTLPATSHTVSHLRDFYRHYRWPIVATQLGELLATWFLWLFVDGLADTVAHARSATAVRASGLLVCAGSLLTAAPVLALAVGLGSADSPTRLLAAWTDYSDIIMSGLIAVFGAVCARAAFPTWVRVAATGLAVVFVAHAVLASTGRPTLNAIAPTLFLAVIVAMSIRMLRLARRRTPSSVIHPEGPDTYPTEEVR